MIYEHHHPEITEQLKEILRVSKEYKKYEASLGRDASAEKKRLSPNDYYQKVLKFNKQSGGNLKESIRMVIHRLGRAYPEFHLIQGMTASKLQEFAIVTEGISGRMNKQLLLAKILEVKDLFKVESDIYKPQNLTRIEALLKELK